MASSGGSASSATPGARTRFGPAKANGLARSDQTGSTSRLSPAVWIRWLAWPIEVTRSPVPSTRAGGGGKGGSSIRFGQGAKRVPSMKRTRSRALLSVEGLPGTKKRVASKWSLVGPV